MTRIAITGAGGFLGRATVAAAEQAGADVRAIVRTVRGAAAGDVRAADLRDPAAVAGILDGVDVLVHLAAAKAGQFHDQYPSTVKATEVLLDEAGRAGVGRVVLVSSFAVYDYAAIKTGSLVDEDAPLDRAGEGRDAYAQTKVLQEDLARDWAQRTGIDLVVARPGVVYGPDSWWTYRIGEQFGPLWLCLGSRAEVPVVHVADCGEALVHLALSPAVAPGAYNVFDPDPPSQKAYRELLAARLARRPLMVPVPWRAAAAGVWAVDRLNRRRAEPLRLPGFLVPQSLAVRAKPLRYSAQRLQATGWRPSRTLAEGLDETFAPTTTP